MRRIRSMQLDVFTDTIFSGNQLAVFFDAGNLTNEEMQAIAREMNFSESIFVLPAASPQAVAHVRIFTPAVEMPFAGHPIIGVTFALAETGVIGPDTDSPITLETGVGPLAIDLLFGEGRLQFAWMSQPLPTFQPWSGNRAALATALGLAPDDLRADLPIERGSAGVPYIYIPITNRAALDLAQPGPAADAAFRDEDPRIGAYLFVAPDEKESSSYSARMFAGGMGVLEDAATGSAAGPFGVYLLRHSLIGKSDGETTVTILQGEKMGRPSRLRVAITHEGGVAQKVRVGGAAVVVAEGEFRLPDAPIRP